MAWRDGAPWQACCPALAWTHLLLARACVICSKALARNFWRARLFRGTCVMAPSYQAAPSVFFRPVELGDLDRVAELEAASYPTDEAASRDRLDFRIKNAPGLFLVAVRPSADSTNNAPEDLVGYVCGTLTAASELTHESMGHHESEGGLLCVHSVCVAEAERRKKLATRMLKAYILYVQQTTPQLSGIRLICKEDLVPLYQGAGFALVGPSPVVHGQDPWIEMGLDLAGEGEDA